MWDWMVKCEFTETNGYTGEEQSHKQLYHRGLFKIFNTTMHKGVRKFNDEDIVIKLQFFHIILST